MHINLFQHLIQKFTSDELEELIRLQNEYEQSVDMVEFEAAKGPLQTPEMTNCLNAMSASRQKYFQFMRDKKLKYYGKP